MHTRLKRGTFSSPSGKETVTFGGWEGEIQNLHKIALIVL